VITVRWVDARESDWFEWQREHDRATAPAHATPAPRGVLEVRYAVAPYIRRAFLGGVAEICWRRQLRWEWDLVGRRPFRKVEISLEGPVTILEDVASEIEVCRAMQGTYWSAGGAVPGGLPLTLRTNLGCDAVEATVLPAFALRLAVLIGLVGDVRRGGDVPDRAAS
jgi:hypothetical protein